MNKYQILFLFENTIGLYNDLEEILRERVYHYKKFSIPLDFWLFKNQEFDYYLPANFKKSFKKYSLVTTNKLFFNWIKLRYGYFEKLEILQKKKFDLNYTIDGYFLSLNTNKIKNLPLKSILFLKN